ncbi:ABC transporter ATP-binding protein [Streptomyces sp. NPDC006235]|uniref:ABC transporter ATP-binding protein n=1 Tax=Streptomyces sp. NPDC006235 TaxID=3156736 RepID=UPI0033B0F4C8
MLGLLRPQRARLAGLMALAAIGVGVYALVPLLLGRATDVVADGITAGTGVDFRAVGRLLLGTLLLVGVAAGLTLFQERATAVIAESLTHRLRTRAVAKLARLPLAYFDGRSRGEVMSRISNDTDNINEFVQQTVAKAATALFTLVGVLAMMFWISPQLALIAAVVVPGSLLVAKVIGRRSQPYFSEMWAATGRLNGHVEEMFTGHELVRGFGRSQEAEEDFRRHNEALTVASSKAQVRSGLIRPAIALLSNLNYVLIAVIGGLRVVSGSLSIGDVQAFFHYSQQLGQPVGQVASMAALIQSGLASAERVFQLLDEEEQSPDPAERTVAERPAGRVVFENVSFGYPGGPALIEGLDLTVEPGSTVAIVGPTGAGKTTLVNLLMRFYEVDGGRITLDGRDIAELPRAELRCHIGLVPQDPWLFNGTIAENIAYGAPGTPRERVVESAVLTHVDHFVRTLPDGYDTLIGEEGENVSAGERQLITIARAFLAPVPVFAMDEATSLVDSRTELLVQRALRRLREGRTCFVIAHRLSTVREADTIVVMEAGRIVEQGSHDELLAANGAYARLYATQFAQPVAQSVE